MSALLGRNPTNREVSESFPERTEEAVKKRRQQAEHRRAVKELQEEAARQAQPVVRDPEMENEQRATWTDLFREHFAAQADYWRSMAIEVQQILDGDVDLDALYGA